MYVRESAESVDARRQAGYISPGEVQRARAGGSPGIGESRTGINERAVKWVAGTRLSSRISEFMAK